MVQFWMIFKGAKSKNLCFFGHTQVSHALQASTQVSWWQIHLSVAAGPHITCAGCCPPYQTPPLYGPQDVEIPYKHHGFSGLCLKMFFLWTGLFFWLVKNTPTTNLRFDQERKTKPKYRSRNIGQTSDGWCSMLSFQIQFPECLPSEKIISSH